MFVKISNGLILAMLLGIVPASQAKTFTKVDSWAKRLLHRVTKNTILNSRQAIIGAVGLAAVSCGNIACEKIQQPMTDVFTQSGDPSVGFNVNHYNMWNSIGGSYHAYSVEHSDPSGTVTSDAAIPINLHSRLSSFGDFRLSIGDGPYRNNIYGVASSETGGSFTIHDAQGAGSSIGSGVIASDRTTLTINVDSNVTLVAEIHNPQIDASSDSVARTINISITDANVEGTTTYSTSANWEYSLSSQLISSPSSIAMPGYQDLADAYGGRDSFVQKLVDMGFAANRALHDSLSTNVYTADQVGGRTRLRKHGGFASYWEEGTFSRVGVRLVASGDTANLSLTKGSSSHVSDLPIGSTATLGQGFQTQNWTLELGELSMLNSALYRSMTLSALSTREWVAFNFVGIHVDQSSQYYIDDAQLSWHVEESMTASGLW